MDNLNKENFFNAMVEKYPDAMKRFLNWIDEYKKSVEWEELFNGGVWCSDDRGESAYKRTKTPKFHDIPYEFQMGIILKFFLSVAKDENVFISHLEMIDLAANCFRDMQNGVI